MQCFSVYYFAVFVGYLIPDLSSLGPGDGSTVWSLLMVGRVVGSSYGEDLPFSIGVVILATVRSVDVVSLFRLNWMLSGLESIRLGASNYSSILCSLNSGSWEE